MMNEKLQELKDLIKSNLNNIKDKKNINTLYEELEQLRKQMDTYDSLWTNLKDWKKRMFAFNKKDKCIVELYDIVTDFKKYSDKDQVLVIKKLEELSKIKDRTFLDKIISVLRAS